MSRPFHLFASFVLAAFLFRASPARAQVPAPIPSFSFQDVNALYTPTERANREHFPGDWNYPKLKKFPRQKELAQECQRDWAATLAETPDPFHGGRPIPKGDLMLRCVTKDPKNRIVYFVFSYESESVYDLFVVYYYDPYQGHFVLMARR